MTFKKWILIIAKLCFATGVMWYLSTQIDFKESFTLMKLADFRYLSLAILILFSAAVVSAWRWQKVCETLGLKESFTFFFKYLYMGLWFNQVLPGGIGGDAVRAYAVHKRFGKGKGGVTSVLFERGAGFIALLIIIGLCTPAALNMFPEGNLFPWGFALAGLSGFFGFIALLTIKYLPIMRNYKILKVFTELSENAQTVFLKNKRLSVLILLTSFLVQISGVVCYFYLAKAIGVSISFIDLLIIIPPTFLLLLIPISFAGWGLREGAVVGLFTLTGVLQAKQALALSLMYGLLTVFYSLPGGLTLFGFTEVKQNNQ